MPVHELDAEVVGDRAEAAFAQSRKQQPGQVERVVRRPDDLHAGAREKRRVERRVLPDDRVEADELFHFARDRREVRRALEFLRVDASERLDAVLEPLVRIDQRVIAVDHAVRVEPDRGDFDDLVALRIEAGRFEVD